ncbi:MULTISPECIES: MFS transporter [Priestia]|uniref:MFS transporter n=1 Tax=Priestia TaxID=2800373 RepID=UPI001ADCCC5B|nr:MULTISPECIES: MFS transporter [Priestia]QTL51152.1 MFS transporter [Priestia aryabhattai]USL44120.1 MFS transporter [Priestia megaterium]
MIKRNKLLILILTVGVFGIINTEMGVIGILPAIAEHFDISVSKAGWLVSAFALTVALCGPTMPLLFSKINRKTVMLLVLGIFLVGNIVSLFATNFTVALIARVIPAIFHPIYFSAAFTIAANTVKKEESPKAVAKVLMGVSAGMVLGVPIASFLASSVSLQTAMLFFAIVNALTFMATLLHFPSMPVKESLSYGAQVSVLRKKITWLSIGTVVLINSAIFGVYSYLAEYLKTVTELSPTIISLILVVFGLSNIIGNIVAGKLLTKDVIKPVVSYPFLLGIVYIILFLTGQFTVPMVIITLVWGIFAGIGNNINQYWITSAAPEAPDFANGLFVTSANIGTTVGTAVGGVFISQLGTQYVILVGILSLILSLITIFLRVYRFAPVQKLSK